METATANNQVSIIENSVGVLKTAPEILLANQQRKDKALMVGRSILSKIEEEGMSPELDDTAKQYLIKINTAGKELKESRAGVTQIMDALKKMYTEVEAEIDPKKDGTIPSKVQAERDKYAKQVAEETERKRKEAERAAAIAKAKIDLSASIEVMMNEYFNDFLLTQKQRFTSKFNSLELDSFADNAAAMRQYVPAYKREHFDAFGHYFFNESARVVPMVLSVNDVKEQLLIVTNGKYEGFADRYVSEMLAHKQDIVDKLSSKHNELQEQRRLEIEAADAARAAAAAQSKAEQEAAEKRQAELKAQQDAAAAEKIRREEEEAVRIAKEAADAQRLAEQEADIKKQGEQTMVMFEQEAAIAESTPAPEVRQGFEIVVLHPVGYTQIFALWFENEGKNLPVDKIGNTKLDQMKAWAEKHAHKTGTKIESKFIRYDETIKAINRKTK